MERPSVVRFSQVRPMTPSSTYSPRQRSVSMTQIVTSDDSLYPIAANNAMGSESDRGILTAPGSNAGFGAVANIQFGTPQVYYAGGMG